MAFSLRNLSVLAYANGFTLWHCKTPDRLAEAAADGYFDAAADMLAAGDLVMISAADGARILVAGPASEGRRLVPLA
ncbi:hypothetical protein [Acidisphaera rubrifaciens]|uniref:Uncharacterized protein n=1 Tax=Acidisphaera rubrifaciens HS-AP3 TaxID=1231350 RepID=A0A0D6P564_9PROT|nr:hypothetical protein [Acidisphaera rubrifaciens]GAN76333.1 hypothetical protein Asru_0086_09 [Acidisphaera rubrifaciens HS-AP3]